MEGKSVVYLTPENVRKYDNQLNEIIGSKGYKTRIIGSSCTRSIEVYRKLDQFDRLCFKHVLCVIHASDYISFGPNEHLRSVLEPLIKQAFKK